MSRLDGEIRLEHHHRYLLAATRCPGLDVLDIASGEGYGAALLASVARTVIGVDRDRESVEFARAGYPRGNLRFLEGDGVAIPLPDRTVDAVTSFETIEHLDDHSTFLREVRRVLRPGGFVLLSTPDRRCYRKEEAPNPFHRKELDLGEFRALLRGAFPHVEILGQGIASGSWIVPVEGPWSGTRIFRTSDGRSYRSTERWEGLRYLVALCADSPQSPLSGGGLVHEGMMPREIEAMRVRLREREREWKATERSITGARETFERECVSLRARCELLDGELARSRQEFAEAEHRGAMQQASLASLEDRLRRAEAEIANLCGERDAERRRLVRALERERALLSQRDAARGEATRLAAERSTILASTSWRASAPIRAVGNWIRTIRRIGPRRPDGRTANQPSVRKALFAVRMARLAFRPGGTAAVREILSLQADARFDAERYLRDHPDVAASRMEPAEHFVLFGRAEGRDAHVGSRPQSVDGSGIATIPNAEPRPIEPAILETARRIIAGSSIRFSIILPTRNRRSTVTRAIDSVLAQSYPHWELIVVDDGSGDGTADMIRDRYAGLMADARLRLIETPPRGVSAARNEGLKAARGEWIAYLDSDNSWRPEYLRITAAGFLATPERRTAYAGLAVKDAVAGRSFERMRNFDWPELARRNFIDLNVFSHHRLVYEQLGGFDEGLSRLVDWDLILRYTRLHPPKFNRVILADYRLSHELRNISVTEPLEVNRERVLRRTLVDRLACGDAPLRLAFVLWDWPALSQTFVLNEVEAMRRAGVDVRVYYRMAPDRAAERAPDVPVRQVKDEAELADALVSEGRNWIHSHFAYPATTLLAWPAAERAGIPFSFMPHAVDIFLHGNRRRNRLADMSRSPLCRRIIVYGDHHARFLTEHGVPVPKIARGPQAVEMEAIRREAPSVGARDLARPLRVLGIGRLVEKKGFADLADAAERLGPERLEVRILGYGPLLEALRARSRSGCVSFGGPFEGSEALAAALAWTDVLCMPCCETADGDVDGMPTVLFEAMAARVPVVAGAVSAIPDFIRDRVDGFLVPPRDPAALAAVLEEIRVADPGRLALMAERAGRKADRLLGPERTARNLLDAIVAEPIDILMVTYARDGHGSWAATERAIRSVLDRTTTPLVLTIVDNGSEAAFLASLRDLARSDPRIRLIELPRNIQCGPATNIGLELARSEFVFYVCSNEGYVSRPGWERAVIEFMRDHPKVGLAGRLVGSPAYPDGAGYLRQPWAEHLRGLEFVRARPEREFTHVQGGVWCLRRAAFERDGGFSTSLPQEHTDVEYSCFLESRGWAIADAPGIVSISNRTRPGLLAHLDEEAMAIHPVLPGDLTLVEFCAGGRGSLCNLCGHRDPVHRPDGFTCPGCGSSPFDRFALRWLALSGLTHRGYTASGVSEPLRRALPNAFSFRSGSDPVRVLLSDGKVDWSAAVLKVEPGGVVLGEVSGPSVPTGFTDLTADVASGMLGLGSRRLVAARRSPGEAVSRPAGTEAAVAAVVS